MNVFAQGSEATCPARPAGIGMLLLLFPMFALQSTDAAGAVSTATGPESFLEELQDIGEAGEPPGWRFRTGAFSSDNIARQPDNELDELVGVAEFGANWHSVGTRFAAAFDGNLAYRTYTENDFDDEGRANFLAVGDVFIVPETFDWYISDRLANAPVDPLGIPSPINVQFVNVLETGPRLTFRPVASSELTVTAARAEINAEESPIDHARNTATLAFMHGLNANTDVGIVADVRQVEFEEDVDAADFDQEQAHLNFETRNDTIHFSAGLGKSRFELSNAMAADDISESRTTGWVQMRARRTSRSNIYTAFERTANDTATAMLRDEQFLEQGGVPGFIVTGDPFFSDSAVIRYNRGWRAHEWFAALNARRFDYFVSPLDRDVEGVRLGGQFSLSTRWLLSATAAATDIEYTDLARTDSLKSLFLEADYRLSRNWSLQTGARYLDRESDDPAYTFAETMFTLFASYSPQTGDGR